MALRGSWLFRGATGFAGAALLLALANLGLVLTNRSLRRQTDGRQQFLQQTAQLNGINETLVRLIAHAAIDEKDQPLRDVLVSHGFRFETETASPAVTPSPSGAAKK